jgi:nuclear transport factor 2 (NTF2) superfamily protein
VRFAYEWHDDSSNWFRSYSNENWAFDNSGLMHRHIANINDLSIKESEPDTAGRLAAARTITRGYPILIFNYVGN